MTVKNPLYENINRKVLKENNNFMAAILGPTGSGKSFCGLKLGENLDPNFDISRVVFSAQEFYKLVNERAKGNIPAASCILFDEAAIDMSNDLHYTNESVVNMKKILQTFRLYRLICLFTFPVSLGFLNKSVRPMFDAYLDGRGVYPKKGYSVFVPHWVQTNTVSGKVYRHSPTGEDEDGKEFVMSHLKVGLPSKDLIKAYEKKKDVFAKKLLRDAVAFETNKVDKDKAKLHGSKIYYDKVMKEPEAYLNKGGTSFNAYIIQFRLSVSHHLARELCATLNNDWERGMIKVKPG
jgi:hypothetical protein